MKLRFERVDYQLAGNRVSEVAGFVRQGSSRLLGDVWFAVDQLDSAFDPRSTFAQPFQVSAEALRLPLLRGYGDVPDLLVALSTDSVLRSLLAEFTELTPQQSSSVQPLVEAILFRWAGVDATSPNGRGPYIDGRRLEALGAFLGQDYVTARGPNPPTRRAGELVADAWSTLLDNAVANLLVQVTFGGALDGVTYDGVRDRPVLLDSLESALGDLASAAPMESVQAVAYWDAVAPVLAALKLESGLDDRRRAGQVPVARPGPSGHRGR